MVERINIDCKFVELQRQFEVQDISRHGDGSMWFPGSVEPEISMTIRYEPGGFVGEKMVLYDDDKPIGTYVVVAETIDTDGETVLTLQKDDGDPNGTD